MKLLVLSSRFPYPIEKGDKLRIYHQIRELSARHEIHLIALSDHPVSESELLEMQQYCKEVHLFRLSKIRIYTRLLWALFRKKPFQQAYFFRPDIARKIQQIATQTSPDMIYCQLVRMAAYCKALPFPKTLDYMDALSLGMERRAEHSPLGVKSLIRREARLLKRYEQGLLQAFDHHTIISASDGKEISPGGTPVIHTIPNGVEVAHFLPQPEASPQYELVFVGNMGYFPNVEAARFLVKKVLPLLAKEVSLLLAGARPDPQVRALASDRVRVSGWVDDIRDAYADGKVFVAPLFTGSGQQNKILEAMAMGLPCVTTSLVNQAIGAVPEQEVLLADSAAAFAGQVERLRSDAELRRRLATAGRKMVEEKYSWEGSVRKLEAIFLEGMDVHT